MTTERHSVTDVVGVSELRGTEVVHGLRCQTCGRTVVDSFGTLPEGPTPGGAGSLYVERPIPTWRHHADVAFDLNVPDWFAEQAAADDLFAPQGDTAAADTLDEPLVDEEG